MEYTSMLNKVNISYFCASHMIFSNTKHAFHLKQISAMLTLRSRYKQGNLLFMKTVNDPSIERAPASQHCEVIHLHCFPPHFLGCSRLRNSGGERKREKRARVSAQGMVLLGEEGGWGIGLRICRQRAGKRGQVL